MLPVHGRADSVDVGDATDITIGERLKLVDTDIVAVMLRVPSVELCFPLGATLELVLSELLGLVEL